MHFVKNEYWPRKFLCALVVIFSLSQVYVDDTTASTIRVEKDGSGDFTQLQPALDAAASGDTLLIGPGEYTEFNSIRLPGYSWDVDIFGYVKVADLTIVGSGTGETVIGPVAPMLDYSKFSSKAIAYDKNGTIRVESLTVRNCYEAIHVAAGVAFVKDCEFIENRYGVAWRTFDSGGGVSNTVISSSAWIPYGFYFEGGGDGAVVRDISTIGCENVLSSRTNTLISGCEFGGGVVGLELFSGATANIENTNIFDCSVLGLEVGPVGSSCHVENSSISGDDAAVLIENESVIAAQGTIFEGGMVAAILTKGGASISIQNSHIIKGEGYAVKCDELGFGGNVNYDITNCYWGTSSGLDISQWIWDRLDNSTNRATVDWFPFSSEEVSDENTSFGSLKSMFR